MFRRTLHSLGLYLLSFDSRDGTTTEQSFKPRQFNRRARDLVETRRAAGVPLTAGSIQLVGLDDVKQMLGRDWRSVAHRAAAVAETTIRAHLTNEDIYTKHGDDTFLICFSNLGKARAAQTARGISQEIREALAQEVPSIAERIGVDDFVAEVDGDDLNSDGRPLTDVLLGSLARMRVEAENTVRERRAILINEARVLFRPMWHVVKRAVQLYRCVLDGNSGGAAMEHFRAISDPDELQGAVAELDLLVFARVVDALHSMIQRQSKALFLIPVHFQTLANKRSRGDYLRLVEGIPPAYKKFLLCEVYSVPPGTPATRLADIVTALQACCRAVVVEVDSQKQLTEVSEANAWALSLDIEDAGLESGELSVQRLKRAITIAKSQRLVTIAHGANSVAQMLSAIEVGFDFVDGEAVHRSLDEPKGAFSFSPPSSTPAARLAYA